MRKHIFFFVLPFSVAACDRPQSAQPGADASAAATGGDASAAIVDASASKQAANGADAAARVERTFLTYHATVGKKGDARIALERAGDKIEGLVTLAGEELDVRGEVKEGGKLTFAEVVPKGKSGVTFSGQIDGARLTGTWHDPKSKEDVPVTGGPLDALGPNDQAFEQTYMGSLAAHTRIRAKLKKAAGGKLSGVYRYSRSREDLKLEGTVNPADGRFELAETNAKGVRTGTIKGVFLQRDFLFGRWESPDGAKSFPLMLRQANAYPEVVTLAGGGKIIPQEDYKEPSKYCSVSFMFPQLVGSLAKEKEKTLNEQLRAAAGDLKKESCADATEDLRYETETTYSVIAQRKQYVSLRYQFYTYAGGAHGMHGIQCSIADLGEGKLTKLSPTMMTPEGRKKLDALADAEIKKQFGAEDVFTNPVKVSDETTLCVEGDQLVVQFQVYEIAPYSMGAPEAKISAKDAYPLFQKSDLVDGLLKETK